MVMKRSWLRLGGLVLIGALHGTSPAGLAAQTQLAASAKAAAPANAPAKPKASAGRESPLAKAVLEHFAAWDADANGKLSAAEVEKEVLNPANQGDAAAALAALHGRFWKAEADARKPLDRAFFDSMALKRPVLAAKSVKPATGGDNEGEQAAGAVGVDDDKDSEKDLDVRFGRSRQSIKGAVRTLFDADGPNLPDCKQGMIGNCFILAPLGAYVHRDAEAIKHMIEPLAGERTGWYRVRFASGDVVELPPFTDAELGLSGASMRSGMWVRVLEKAFGTRKLKPEDREDRVARDEIGKGGSGASTVRLLTGHQTIAIKPIGDWTRPIDGQPLNSAQGAGRASEAVGPPEPAAKPATAAEFEKILSQLRKQLPIAFDAKRLVVAGTPSNKVPISISPRHAYAVLGFDPATDRITLWNPHASTFVPKGEEGFKFGYKRHKGLMTLPLVEFARIFRGVNIETDRPLIVRAR